MCVRDVGLENAILIHARTHRDTDRRAHVWGCGPTTDSHLVLIARTYIHTYCTHLVFIACSQKSTYIVLRQVCSWNTHPDMQTHILYIHADIHTYIVLEAGGLVEHARLDGGGQQVVGGRDGVDVPREVQVELLHGHHLDITLIHIHCVSVFV